MRSVLASSRSPILHVRAWQRRHAAARGALGDLSGPIVPASEYVTWRCTGLCVACVALCVACVACVASLTTQRDAPPSPRHRLYCEPPRRRRLVAIAPVLCTRCRGCPRATRPQRRGPRGVTSLNCARRTARRAAPARCAACSATARRRNSKVRHAHTILPHTFVCAGSPRVLRCCSDGRRPCVFRTVSGTHRPGRRQRAGSADAFYAGAAYLRRMCQRRRAPGAR